MARSFGKIANGSLRVTTTVESFGVAMPGMREPLPSANSLAPRMGYRGQPRPPRTFGSSTRCQLLATCRATKGVPSVKVTPRRRWKVYTEPSAETSQLVASPGTTRASGVNRVRPSKR